jgi:hypothetical protein
MNQISNNEPGVHSVPDRCHARTRYGHPCPNFAGKNGRCRRHGGLSTGPRTPEGLNRSRRANWQHGEYSAESKAMQKQVREIMQQAMAGMNEIQAYLAKKPVSAT